MGKASNAAGFGETNVSNDTAEKHGLKPTSVWPSASCPSDKETPFGVLWGIYLGEKGVGGGEQGCGFAEGGD